MSQVRRLQRAGIEAFEAYLGELRGDPLRPPPYDLLTSLTHSEGLGTSVAVTRRTFATRRDMAEYLFPLFEDTALKARRRDEGLWSWLSLYFFDAVCPPDGNGKRAVKDTPRYILEATNFRTYYRHLLAGPLTIFTAHRDDPDGASALLCGPLDSPGELVEQIASRMELASNREFVRMATRLYFDPVAGKLRRGSGGSGAGSPRRLAQVQQQLDLTFDFYSLTADEMLALLPKEFDRYR